MPILNTQVRRNLIITHILDNWDTYFISPSESSYKTFRCCNLGLCYCMQREAHLRKYISLKAYTLLITDKYTFDNRAFTNGITNGIGGLSNLYEIMIDRKLRKWVNSEIQIRKGSDRIKYKIKKHKDGLNFVTIIH